MVAKLHDVVFPVFVERGRFQQVISAGNATGIVPQGQQREAMQGTVLDLVEPPVGQTGGGLVILKSRNGIGISRRNVRPTSIATAKSFLM
jgi:hypothetical protein